MKHSRAYSTRANGTKTAVVTLTPVAGGYTLAERGAAAVRFTDEAEALAAFETARTRQAVAGRARAEASGKEFQLVG